MSSNNRVSLFSELPLAKRIELFKGCEMDEEEFERRLEEANKWLREKLRVMKARSENEARE